MKRLIILILFYSFAFGQAGGIKIDRSVTPNTWSISGYFLLSNIYHIYGGFQNQAETIELTTGNWGVVTNATEDLWVANEYDGITMSGDTMIFTYTGDYTGSLSLTMSGSNNDECFMRVYNVTQAAAEGYLIGFTGIGATAFRNVSMSLYFDITAGDRLVLQVMNSDSNDDIIVRSSIFYISYLHD